MKRARWFTSKKLVVLALSAVAALVLIAGYSNYSGVNSYSGYPLQVGGNDIAKPLYVPIDSLGASSSTLLVFTPPRNIRINQIDIYAKTAFVGVSNSDTARASLFVRSGSTVATGYVDSGGTYQSTSVAVTFTAAVPCTVFSDDGGGNGTGGVGGNGTVWMTDY